MNSTVLCLGILTLVMAGVSSRECVYDTAGLCMYDCPKGTHSYTTGCSPRTPEPTCDEPNPVEDDYDLCDYSDCYCDAPTVRDTVSKNCVKLEDCPKEVKPVNEHNTVV